MASRNIGIGINISPQDINAINQLIASLTQLRSVAGQVNLGGGGGGGAPPGGGGNMPGPSPAQTQQSAQQAQQAAQGFQAMGNAAQQAQEKGKGLGQIFGFLKGAKGRAMEMAQSVATIGLALQGVNEITGTLQMAFGGFYDATIGANERLNQEILKTQANLAATSKVILNGRELEGAESVRATASSLKDALKQLELETMSLVGVTSADVNGVFNTVLSNVAAITGQSKEYRNAIESSIPLAKSMTAAIGVMGMRLDEVGQEFGSLVKAEITEDSRLAKSLGINNAMVRQWRAQGKAVDEILKRLEPFVNSNAMAARSVAGISSNIKDIFEILSREAGKPLLEPIVKLLEKTFGLLNNNKEAIVTFFGGFGFQVGAIANQIEESLGPAIGDIVKALGGFGAAAGGIFRSLLEVVRSLIPAVKPLADAFSGLLLKFAEFANTEFGQMLIKGWLMKLAADTAIDKISGSVGGLADSLGKLTSIAEGGRLQLLFNMLAGGDADGLGGLLATSYARGNQMIGQRGAQMRSKKGKGGEFILSGGVAGAAETAAGLAGAFPTLAAGKAALASGFAGMKTSLAGMVPLLQAAGTTLLGLLPVIAAIGVAATGVFLALKTNEMKKATEQMAFYSKEADRASESNFKLAGRVKELSDIQKYQRDLTTAEKEELERLQAQNTINTEKVAIRIKNAEAALASMSGQRRKQQEAFIAGLRQEYAALASLNTLDVSFKDLLDLGPVAEQLEFQITGAFQKVEEGVQTSDELAQHYQTIMEMSGQQFNMGLINAEEYRDRLRAVVSDTRLPLETIQEARQQLNAIDEQVQQRSERTADAILAELERQVTLGQLSGVEGAEMLAEARMDKLQTKLDDLNARINDQAQQIATMMGDEESRLRERRGEVTEALATGRGATETERKAAQETVAKASEEKTIKESQLRQLAIAAVETDRANKEAYQFGQGKEAFVANLALRAGEFGSEAYLAEKTRLGALSVDELLGMQLTPEDRERYLKAQKSGLTTEWATAGRSRMLKNRQAYEDAVANRMITGEEGAAQRQAISIAEDTITSAQGVLTNYDQPSREAKKALQEEAAKIDERLGDIDATQAKLEEAQSIQDRLQEMYREGATGAEFSQLAVDAVEAQNELLASTEGMLDPALVQEFQQTAAELAQELAEAPLRIAQAMIEEFDRGQREVMSELQVRTAQMNADITAAMQAGTMGEGRAAELQTAAQQDQLELAEDQARDRLRHLRRVYAEHRALTGSERAAQEQEVREAEMALAEATQQRMEHSSKAALEITQGYLAELSRSQDAAMGVLRRTQAEREAIITEMFHGFQVLGSEAEGARLQMERDTLEAELRNAAERLAVLQKAYDENPALDPRDRAEQLQQLTEAQISHSTLTKQLLDNEGALTDNIVAQEKERLDLLERRIQIEMGLLGRSEQEAIALLDRKAKSHEIITQQLDAQVRLYQAQNQLADAQAGVVTGALGLLERTATTERERQRMAQTRALIEVEMAEKRYKTELASLELQKQQNELALARKDIEAQRAMESAKGERRSTIAEQNLLLQRRAQIERDGTISEEERDLRLKEVEAELFNNQMRRQQSEFALQDAAMGMQLIGVERQIIDAQFEAQRQQTIAQGEMATLSARAAYGEAMGTRGRGIQRELRREVLDRLGEEFGTDSIAETRMGLDRYRRGGAWLYGRQGREARRRGERPEERFGGIDVYDSRTPRMPGMPQLSPQQAQEWAAAAVREIDREAWDAIGRSETQHRPVVRDGGTDRGGQVDTQIDTYQAGGGGGYMAWAPGVAGGYGEGVRTVEDIMGEQGPIPPGAAQQISDIVRDGISGGRMGSQPQAQRGLIHLENGMTFATPEQRLALEAQLLGRARPTLQGTPLNGDQVVQSLQATAQKASEQTDLLTRIDGNLTRFLSTGGTTLETTINNHFPPSVVPEDVEQAVLNANYEILRGLQQRRGLA